MTKEQRLKAAEAHARKVCGEYYDLMYENEPAIQYSMGQLCTDDFIAGAEAEAESNKAIPYQCCPKCNGQGSVSKPPYISGNVHSWSSSGSVFTCDVCNGAKIIPMYIPPLNQQ